MRIALAFILTLMLCLTGPAQIAFACGGGGGGGGNEGVDESASTQTSDPDEPPPGFILSGDTPSINVGLSGSTSDPLSGTSPEPQSGTSAQTPQAPAESQLSQTTTQSGTGVDSVARSGDPGVSITGQLPQSRTVVPHEGEPQDPWLTRAEQLNQTREALGLEPVQTVVFPGASVAVVNGQIVPVMGPGGPPPAPIRLPPGLGMGTPLAGVVNPFIVIQGTGPTPAQQAQMANTANAVVTHATNIGAAYYGSIVVGGPVGVGIVATWGVGSTLARGGTLKEAGVSAAINVATFNLLPHNGEVVSVIVSRTVNRGVDNVMPYLEPVRRPTSYGTGHARPPLHK